MSKTENPERWTPEDETIASLLNAIDVPSGARMRAKQRLLEQAEQQPARAGKVGKPRVLWLGLAAVAASVLFGFLWWKATQPLSRTQLIAVCQQQLDVPGTWSLAGNWGDSDGIFALSEVLGRALKSPPGAPLEYRTLTSTRISPRGKVWKLPMPGRRDLYVLEFESPRSVENISGQLQMLSGVSQGWSMAAVIEQERLFVFISKDDLRDTLRIPRLA
jgi:hypothetical protein